MKLRYWSKHNSAARNDWGWQPQHDFEGAFTDYLIPGIRERYLAG